MKYKKIVVSILFFLCVQRLHADAKSFFEGLGEGIFGIAPKNASLHFDILNNYSENIVVSTRRITSAMGGFYEHSFSNQHVINAYSSTLKLKKSKKSVHETTDVSVQALSSDKSEQKDANAQKTEDGKDASSDASDDQSDDRGVTTNKWYHNLVYYQALFMNLSSDKPTDLMLQDNVTIAALDYPKNVFFKQYFLQAIPVESVTQYYHVYTGKRLVDGRLRYGPMVEMIGVFDAKADGQAAQGNITFDDQLASILFFNATDKDWVIRCEMNGSVYTQDIVDSACFAKLSAPDGRSLARAKISMIDQGTKKVVTSMTVPDIFPNIPGQDKSCTLELYQSGGKYFMGMQGFSTNAKDTPISEHVKDITPTAITVWYQSAQGGQANGSLVPLDLPGSVWYVYVSGKRVVQQKITPGSVFTQQLFRPSVPDGIGYVYFLYIESIDDTEAQKFISDFVSGAIKAPFLEQYKTLINTPYSQDQAAAANSVSGQSMWGIPDQKTISEQNTQLSKDVIAQVMSGKANMDGLKLQDAALLSKASGGQTPVQGFLIGIDVFFPSGVSSPNFYYMIAPSQMDWAAFAKNVSQYIDTDKVQTAGLDITRFVQMIYQQHFVNQAAAESALENFLKQYGTAQMLDESGNLTKYGKNRMLSLFDGPVSFSYPPLLLSAVQSLFTNAPDGLPTSTTSTQTPQNATQSSQTQGAMQSAQKQTTAPTQNVKSEAKTKKPAKKK